MSEIKINIEIADTPDLLAQGLMHRKTLDWNNGMLFKFPFHREASFWGKNTYIPLDVAFIDKNGIIFDIKKIAPLSTRQIWSSGPCSMALETNAGFFDKNKINIGTKIEVLSDSNGVEKELVIKNAEGNKL